MVNDSPHCKIASGNGQLRFGYRLPGYRPMNSGLLSRNGDTCGEQKAKDDGSYCYSCWLRHSGILTERTYQRNPVARVGETFRLRDSGPKSRWAALETNRMFRVCLLYTS